MGIRYRRNEDKNPVRIMVDQDDMMTTDLLLSNPSSFAPEKNVCGFFSLEFLRKRTKKPAMASLIQSLGIN